MKVKICGITNLEDALSSIKYGADAIGFVFYDKSPRFINFEDAKNIVKNLPPFIYKVGLFVNCEISKVEYYYKKLNLNIVQLHGDEDKNFCDILDKKDIPYIKALRVKKSLDFEKQLIDYKNAKAILCDAFDKNNYGGTGKVFDWNLLDKYNKKVYLILAGGLNCGNVQEAILKVKPYAVDTSSGVEAYKGKKDIAKLKKFIKLAKYS